LIDDGRKWVEWAPVEYEKGPEPRCVVYLEDL
jgi:hypothetical protein